MDYSRPDLADRQFDAIGSVTHLAVEQDPRVEIQLAGRFGELGQHVGDDYPALARIEDLDQNRYGPWCRILDAARVVVVVVAAGGGSGEQYEAEDGGGQALHGRLQKAARSAMPVPTFRPPLRAPGPPQPRRPRDRLPPPRLTRV